MKPRKNQLLSNVCTECKKVYFNVRRKAKSIFLQRKFCSHKCLYAYQEKNPPNKGKKRTEEQVQKMREVQTGRKHSQETKEKISNAFLREKHPNWRGGISYRKDWYKRNANLRKIRKDINGGSHTLGEWENLKAQYNWTCPCCGKKEDEIKLSKDHIIPIAKGGSDNIENIQPLCRRCNAKKHTQETRYYPLTN